MDSSDKQIMIESLSDEKKTSSQKTYLYYHKLVRNDDHCPICRRFYISIHTNKKDAISQASEDIDDSTDVLYLEKYGDVWIDEWVRRRNGDQYKVFEIELNKTYKFFTSDYSYSEDGKNIEKDMKKLSIENSSIQYVLLHVDINKSEWCPYNIKYSVSFHNTLDDACEKVSDFCDKSNIEELKKLQPVWIPEWIEDLNNCTINTTDKDMAKIKQTGNGDYYQIIKMEYDKQIYLNEYCKYVQPDVWFD
jgi:hypothetical protein